MRNYTHDALVYEPVSKVRPLLVAEISTMTVLLVLYVETICLYLRV